jgi:hypothetical protein
MNGSWTWTGLNGSVPSFVVFTHFHERVGS